jgi:hypothetical protein
MSGSKTPTILAITALAVAVLAATPIGQAAGRLVLPINSVGSAQIKKNAVTSPKVKNNSLTGADVLESTLGKVPSSASADSAQNATHATSSTSATSATNAAYATNASNATNAAQLGGIAASAYLKKCATGSIKGYVFIHGSASFPSTFTTDPAKVSSPYNCGAGTIEAKRVSVGNYEVRFNGNPSALGLGSMETSPYIGPVELEPLGPGHFDVYVIDTTNTMRDCGFVLALL